jgi:phosphomethylpyrimidine synthase
MTLLEQIKNGQIPATVVAAAQAEHVPADTLAQRLAAGTAVITKNNNRRLKKLVAVGEGLRTKVNANIGTSPDHISVLEEKEKLAAAVQAGADAVMDLSTGGDLKSLRRMILDECPVPVGTVPLYQVAAQTLAKGRKISQMDPELMFDVIEQQAEEGVDFMTVHCGVTREVTALLGRQKRLVGIVSRGGAFLARWIAAQGRENPLYEQYDRLLKIAAKHDVTLSLGDGLRPGCTADANDGAQIAELSLLGELVERARAANVQAIIEGPGHMTLDLIQGHVQLAKRLGHGAPLYLLGPLVTDVAAGYDHITSAIGGAIAASAGVDFLCYVTPAEHLRLPDADDVYQGVIASRIAGHAADLVKNVPGARAWDDEFSKYRKALDWQKQQEMALDPVKFKAERARLTPQIANVCTMCGEFCAMRDDEKGTCEVTANQ